MKKFIYYILLFIIVCFIIPLIFVRKVDKQIVPNSKNKVQESKETNYEYKKYEKIRLLHKENESVEELPIDEYLYGVVASEMPATFEKEALKAQAVVARTYTIYKIENDKSKHENADICDDPSCCQAWISKEDRFEKWDSSKKEEYWNKITSAVDSTKGKVIVFEGKIINAFFHANSGGKTETTANVWGGEGYPYLQTVETSGEDTYSQYASEVTLTKQTFIDKIKEKHPDFSIDFKEENCIKTLEYTEGGRVKNIKIGNLELSGVEVRNILGLKSANFSITMEEEKIKIEVLGYGHGVGMSQTGADSMAKQGSNYEDIIKHFYTNVEIVSL